MFLVLCSAVDQSAAWAYEHLRRCGIAPIHLVTTESLAYARWDHRVGAAGNTITITLPDGRVVNSREIQGVLNRVTTIGADQANRATQGDRDYALSELNAFYLSWLYCLPGVVNRTTPQGLCGRWRHPSEWTALAQQAGLPVRTYRQSEQDAADRVYGFPSTVSGTHAVKAVVFRDRVFGASLPDCVAEASIRFAALAGLDLMGVDFEINSNGDCLFASASPSPDLFLGGTELIGALARSWHSKGEFV